MTTAVSLTLRRIGRSCALLGFAVWLPCGPPRANAADIEVFTRDGCPRCAAAKEFLAELRCTAGLPAVYTHVLALHELSSCQHYAYLGLYNAAYVLDDGLMVAISPSSPSRGQAAGAGRAQPQAPQRPGHAWPRAVVAREARLAWLRR